MPGQSARSYFEAGPEISEKGMRMRQAIWDCIAENQTKSGVVFTDWAIILPEIMSHLIAAGFEGDDRRLAVEALFEQTAVRLETMDVPACPLWYGDNPVGSA